MRSPLIEKLDPESSARSKRIMLDHLLVWLQWRREGGGPGGPRTPPICQTDYFFISKKNRGLLLFQKYLKNIHRFYLIVFDYLLLRVENGWNECF